MQIRQKHLLDARLLEVPWRGGNHGLHLPWTSWRPEVGGSNLYPCHGPLPVCGLPRASTTALSCVLPNFFPMAFCPVCCPTTQPGPSAYGMTTAIPCHGNVSARVCWLCMLATPFAMVFCLYMLSNFSATALCPCGLHNPGEPWPSALVSCRGPLALWTV